MCRFLIAYMFICFAFITDAFGQTAEIERIKSGLTTIKDTYELKGELSENPLAGLDFKDFASRAYLYYYRALGSWLTVKKKTGEAKLKVLDLALDDLQQAQNSPYVEQTQTENLIGEVQKEKIETVFQLRKYLSVIDTIEKLPQKDQKDTKFILYYAEALFFTNQKTLFSSLASRYLSLLMDQNLVRKLTLIKPNWDQDLLEISREAMPIKLAKRGESSDDGGPSQKEILAEPAGFLDYIASHFYISESEKIYRQTSNLYFSLIKTNNTSDQEKRFITLFQNAMVLFPPSFLEDLINRTWKNHRLDLAERLSLVFLKKFPGHPSYPKILFNIARIQEDGHNYKAAQQSYRTFLEAADDEPNTEVAMFRLGWVSFLSEDYKTARSFFSKYIQEYSVGRYASTCEYFLLKIADKLLEKSQTERESNYREYARKYPLNIYTLILLDEWKLSSDQLLTSLSSADSSEALQKEYSVYKADITTLLRLKIYDELYIFDMKAEASRFLINVVFDENNETLLIHLVGEFSKLNNVHGEDLSLTKLFTNVPQVRRQIPWKRLFPTFQIEKIKKILNDQGSNLSPYLVLSIMRQESAFNSEAHSAADAFGLMQLTMSTAKQSAKSLGMDKFDLLSEDDNIRLGIRTFSGLLNKFKNRLDFALSGYNAGEIVTKSWVDLNGNLAPIEFIESIPYIETRLYVKNVLRNFAIYRLLYDGKSSPVISYTNPGESAIEF